MRDDQRISVPVGTLRRVVLIVLIVAVLTLVLTAAWQQRDRLLAGLARGPAGALDPDAYQAVFLTGGQVYFGRLSIYGNDYILLSDVFYLPQQEPQSEANEGQLIKRGNELHGPREPMIIPVGQVLFIENLKPDAPVVTAIRKYHSGTPGSTAPPPTPRPATSRPATPGPTATR